MLKVEKLPVLELDILSKIMKDYIAEVPEIDHLYKYKKNLDEFKRVIADKSKQKLNREVLSDELKKQYNDVENNSLVIENIELLKDNNTFSITTAHQLCMFTGPMYFIYKTISAVKLCKILKEKYPDNNFVPIFWLGSEDHDFEEINHLNLYGNKVEWERSRNGAVGKMTNKNLSKTIDSLSEILFKGEENDFINQLRKIFKEEKNYGKSFLIFLHSLFGKYGLVVLEQDNKNFKKMFAEKIFLELQDEIVKNNISKELNYIDTNYKVQAKPRDINLFYLKGEIRERIIKNNNEYLVKNTAIKFTQKELFKDLEINPEHYSPNVLFRPLYQESILPNLAYIGGGGELAYWLQLQSLFDSQQTNFPMLLLRDMGLVISKKIEKNITKIGFDKKSLFFHKDKLIKELVKVASSKDVSIENELNKLNKLYIILLEKAVIIDKSLEPNILSEQKKATKSLQNIEQKMIRSEKRNNEVLVAQLSSIKDKLFPNNKLQERVENFLPYYIKYGDDFFDLLIENFNPLLAEIKLVIEK